MWASTSCTSRDSRTRSARTAPRACSSRVRWASASSISAWSARRRCSRWTTPAGSATRTAAMPTAAEARLVVTAATANAASAAPATTAACQGSRRWTAVDTAITAKTAAMPSALRPPAVSSEAPAAAVTASDTGTAPARRPAAGTSTAATRRTHQQQRQVGDRAPAGWRRRPDQAGDDEHAEQRDAQRADVARARLAIGQQRDEAARPGRRRLALGVCRSRHVTRVGRRRRPVIDPWVETGWRRRAGDLRPGSTDAPMRRPARRPSVVGMTAMAIEIRGLRKRYRDVEAVRGIDLDVRRGEVFAFLGPNGAGKTTTVEILEGFRQRTDGDVRVLGADPFGAAALVAGADRRRAAGVGAGSRSHRARGGGAVRRLPRRSARRRRDPRAGGARRPARRHGHRRCPAASVAGSTSLWPWSGAPSCCSWTSPPPGSIRPRGAPRGR